MDATLNRSSSDDIVMKLIGRVRSSRSEMLDDSWGSETAVVELDSFRFSPDSLLGLSDFSHAEILFFLDKVEPEKIARDARRPRNNTN